MMAMRYSQTSLRSAVPEACDDTAGVLGAPAGQ